MEKWKKISERIAYSGWRKVIVRKFRVFIKNRNDERMNGNVGAAYLTLDELGWL